jgi:hypothetical protein
MSKMMQINQDLKAGVVSAYIITEVPHQSTPRTKARFSDFLIF